MPTLTQDQTNRLISQLSAALVRNYVRALESVDVDAYELEELPAVAVPLLADAAEQNAALVEHFSRINGPSDIPEWVQACDNWSQTLHARAEAFRNGSGSSMEKWTDFVTEGMLGASERLGQQVGDFLPSPSWPTPASPPPLRTCRARDHSRIRRHD